MRFTSGPGTGWEKYQVRLSIPLKLIGISIGAVLALIKSILFLPARMLGYRG